MEASALQKKWILYGAVAGILITILYPVIYYLEITTIIDLGIELIFGIGLAVASIGIYHFVRIHKNCICLQAGGAFGLLSGFTLILAAGFHQSLISPPEEILIRSEQKVLYMLMEERIHLGLEFSWIFLLASSIFAFSVAFFRQPKPGKLISYFGIAFSSFILGYNFYSMTDIAGYDTFYGSGPFLITWHFVVSVLLITSLKWIKEKN